MILKPSGLGRILFFIAAITLTGLPAHAQDEAGQDEATRALYTVNPGDVLAISVWKEEDLQRGVIVRPDGRFSFPLAGDVQAEGKTIEEITRILEEKLSRYIPDLVVTVSAEQILGNKIYVIGQVNSPGQFVVSTQVDVTQALSIAGGANAFAQTNDIKILRRNRDGRQSAIRFRFGDIEAGKRLEQNIVLQPGDVVIVP